MYRVGYVLGALLLVACALTPVFAQQPFADVPLTHWAYNAVNSLAEQGILEGYPAGTFQGKERLTRYEFAQAIARLMARMEEMGGVPGPPGPPGPAGAPGAGGGGLTAEQQKLIKRLASEFGPELKALRADVDSLTKRVEDLEAAPAAEMPTITVSGDISWRMGLYGSSLGLEDVETNAYWRAPIVFDAAADGQDYVVSVPVTDGLKDAYKAGDFMTQKTRINFSGQLADDVTVNVSVLAGPDSNELLHAGSDNMLALGSPQMFSGNGVMDTVSVDEAWLMHSTRILGPADLVIGKQYFRRGQGLLADNDQEAIKALRVDWGTGDSLAWGSIWGMLDREQFYGASTGLPTTASYDGYDPQTSGQDNYNLYYLDWALSDDWALGANWLDSGFNQESGWSAGLDGKLYGMDFYGEYAQLTDWPTGEDKAFTGLDLDESDTAWMAGLRWSGDAVCVTGEYGEIDAGYAGAFSLGGWSPGAALVTSAGMYGYGSFELSGLYNLPLSALHPNAEVDPHDINWIDRPLFLDPTNVAKGWHVNVTFPKLLGPNTPVSVSYVDGDAYDPAYIGWLALGGSQSGLVEPDKWRDGDSVWTVKISRQLSDSVSANLLYGRREVENVMASQYATLIGDVQVEDDPIQVIRGEVIVAF